MPKLSLAKLERHLYSAADRLRQEGLDAATYKDYIFGMLFLKRCSDVFEAERENIVGRKVQAGLVKDEAEKNYGENPDFYDTFFVPERARWDFLQSKLGDATEPFGSRLDKALGALTEDNESLQHVLDHISFMRVQSNKRIVSDDACKDLVRHFSRYRLRNEDFQFSDLLGAAYEFLINMFAESAGKKGGDFYTPRDVIRLMVRILKPRPGMSVYDPTCGSGGMLLISREFVEQSGGDPTNLRLCGQVNDASAWSICKLNMLLHSAHSNADIQLQDTLLHPMHRESGELERFDRVVANPPFSQNYTQGNMEFRERFRWGWCPTKGKKGDLMFAQHMLAVCKPGGVVATVMPHGVLFRGGEEKKIRQKLLEQDIIDAIIGLPPNLFYGAGIPACILVMRPNLTGQALNQYKPENRRDQVLFINADAEFHAGRAQNYLKPEHVEKIVSTYDRFEDVPGYARRVPIEEIASAANDWNLNIRRYVDNAPPPEPHDVRAHLHGGVPLAEVEAKRALCESLGFDPAHAFVRRSPIPSGNATDGQNATGPSFRQGLPESSTQGRDPADLAASMPSGFRVPTRNDEDSQTLPEPSFRQGLPESSPPGSDRLNPAASMPSGFRVPTRNDEVVDCAAAQVSTTYLDFAPALAERAAIRPLIENDSGVQTRAQATRDALGVWWAEHASRLAELPARRDLNAVRSEFLDSFIRALLALATLDGFKLAGVIATWWTDTLPDFKTLMENGFPGVIDGWVDAIADAVEDDDNVGPAFDPFAHKLVRHTMSDYLKQIAEAKTEIARLKGDKEAFEQRNPPDDAEEEELANWNYAKEFDAQIRDAKTSIKERLDAAKPLRARLKAVAKDLKATEKAIALLDGQGTKSIARARKQGLPTVELESALRTHQYTRDALRRESDELTRKLSGIDESCRPDRERIAEVEAELAPYEQIKTELTTARARYRMLTNAFVDQLKARCGAMSGDEKQSLVLELFAQDVHTGLDAAVSEKRQVLVRFVEGLWDKYRVTLHDRYRQRSDVQASLASMMLGLGYT